MARELCIGLPSRSMEARSRCGCINLLHFRVMQNSESHCAGLQVHLALAWGYDRSLGARLEFGLRAYHGEISGFRVGFWAGVQS